MDSVLNCGADSWLMITAGNITSGTRVSTRAAFKSCARGKQRGAHSQSSMYCKPW